MISIRRQGSFFYASAYRRLVRILIVGYLAAGVALGLLAIYLVDRLLAGVIIFGMAIGFSFAMWLAYQCVLWMFGREARQTIEMSDEGIREKFDGREKEFITWKGVKEIELAATLGSGASLRVNSNFSRISISNVDLVVIQPMSIREMHRVLGQTGPLMELLAELRRLAPHAELKMNRLARRRMAKQIVVHQQDGEARL